MLALHAAGDANDAADDTPELLLKLQERKERHKQRHIVAPRRAWWCSASCSCSPGS